MDPVTLVVTAVALGASVGLTDTASSVIKDAYAGLKGLLTRRQVDLTGVERRPTSIVQREALSETLADLPHVVDEELLAAAQHLTDAIVAHQPESEAVAAVGVDLRDVQAEFIRVRSISSSGAAFRGEALTLRGGLDLGDVRAGRLPDDTRPTER
jgi:hypothetical protein